MIALLPPNGGFGFTSSSAGSFSDRPFSFTPALMGLRAAEQSIRQLKKGMVWRILASVPIKNRTGWPLRKNARFSGKKKRVRLICRVSTSVSAKSVWR